MAITLGFTTPPGQWFTRAYIKGFVGSLDGTNLHIANHFVTWDYLFPIYRIDLLIVPEFEAANSNRYTLDHIFDPAGSQVYASGVPIAAGLSVGFWPMQTESSFRIQVHSNFSVKETERADLVPLANYWRSPV